MYVCIRYIPHLTFLLPSMICTLILVLSAFPVRMVSLFISGRFVSVMTTFVLAGSCLRYADMALSQSSVLIND